MDIAWEKKRVKSRSLAQRVASAMWMLSTLICAFTIFLSTLLILRNADEQAKQRIKAEQSNLISLGLIDLIALNEFVNIVPRLPDTLGYDRLSEIIRIYEPPGKLVYTNVRIPDFADVKMDRRAFVNHDFYVVEGASRQYLSLLRSHKTSDGQTLWIEISTTRQTPSFVLRRIAIPFAVIFIAVLLISLVMARRISRLALVPLGLISRQMDQFDVATLKSWQPIPLREQPKEFRSMVIKFNELLTRVQAGFLKVQQLSQFITHELRTPLTVLRGEIETSLMNPKNQKPELETTLRSGLEEVEKMDHIVQTVLRFSVLEPDAKIYRPATIDLRILFTEILPPLERWINRKISFEVGKNLKPIVFVDRDLFSLLISNLVRNIAKHTPESTEASILIHSGVSGAVIVEISDRGPGLPAEVLEAVNQEEAATEHLGIGLRLCRQIAIVSRLDLRFENRAEGGVTARISCPALPFPDL